LEIDAYFLQRDDFVCRGIAIKLDVMAVANPTILSLLLGASLVAGHAPTAPADQIGGVDAAYQPPAIEKDVGRLPFPTRQMHRLLTEAARSGEIERLRPYIGSGHDVTLLSFGELEGDPIDFLKSLSGDGEGYEILAILQEVLEADFVTLEKGTPDEIHVWPYFYGVRLDELTPPQRVELYRLLTHNDHEEMANLGAYMFYRVGITPEGRWRFFVAGD
jgi:hypothetical protein